MKEKTILISKPHYGKDYLKYLYHDFSQNGFDNYSVNIHGFESDIKRFLRTNNEVAALNSGTSAIHLALILAGVKKGNEVLCQSMTFSASVNPIIYQGAKPIFVDSEIDTWNMCPIQLEKAIKDGIRRGKKQKAIIVVHLYGMPAKIDKISEIARKYEIPLIEDAAEALGSTYKGKKCGAFGDYGILSFNSNKIITTSGGGALVCSTIEMKEKAIFLSTQAKDYAPHYQHSKIGYNYRMSNILAGIGRAQIELLQEYVSLRRKNNSFYKDIFKKIDGITVFEEPNKEFYSNHWLTCILVNKEKTGFDREDLRLELLKKNIESRPLWKPMHLQPVFERYPYYGDKVSENLFKMGLCLPSGSNLSSKDKAFIRKTILDFINH